MKLRGDGLGRFEALLIPTVIRRLLRHHDRERMELDASAARTCANEPPERAEERATHEKP
jgi:hypothetical protein